MRTTAIIAILLLFPALVSGQPGYLMPGDNLVVRGVPKIPTGLVEEVARYTESRAAALADWHPARREMLISTRLGDAPQLHLVRFPGGARTQLTFFPEPVSKALYQPRTGDSFVFSKGQGGNERFQLYRFDIPTGAVTRLTDGTSRNTGPLWSRSGDRLVYGSTRRNGADVDLYLLDPSIPGSERLLVELKGGGWTALDWSPDDKNILALEYISINESYLWLVDAAGGTKTCLTPAEGKAKTSFGQAKFAPDGKGIYFVSDRDSEFRRLVYRELATRKELVLTANIPWDIEDFDLSPDGRTMAVVANEDGMGILHLLDPASGKELPVPKLPAGSVARIQWHPKLTQLAFHLTSARSPFDVYSLDPANGEVERWTQSETGGLNTDSFAEPERIRWRSHDDRMISGFLYKSAARFAGKRPVVIDIHGGPESQFRPGFLARKNYYLNELGVALIFPNIRGSAGYGKTFLQLDNGFKRVDAYKDIGALLDWIKNRPDLDADRIMVTGGSYGGHMTLAVAALYADKIRCAVDVVGMSNLVTFLEHTESYRRDLRRAEYGDEREPAMRAFMEKIAPLTNAAKIRKPFFIIQGKNDPRVPWTESEQMATLLHKQGTPVWYLMALDEGHGFAKKKNADFQFYATVLFMREYLLK